MSENQNRTYTLGLPHQKTGLGGLSMASTVVLGVGFVLFLVLMMSGANKAAWMIFPIFGILFGAVTVKINHRTLGETSWLAIQAMKKNFLRENLYVSGFFSRVPEGMRQLPGLLARTDLLEGIQPSGETFGILADRSKHEATVLFDLTLTGQTARTLTEKNQLTAAWAHFLSSLSLTGDVTNLQVVVATRPSTGSLMLREVESIISPEAPELAKAIVRESAQTISQNRPDMQAHLAITVKVDGDRFENNTVQEVFTNRMLAWTQLINTTGMLAVPLDTEAVLTRARCFFEPAMEGDFEELDRLGLLSELDWKDTCSGTVVALPSMLVHGGCRSVTWEMVDAPRATFEDTILTNLIQPHGRIPRKRVCLNYRPIEAGRGARLVESEHRDALVAANSSKKITSAKAELRLEHTNAARQAQARGAQLGRFSMFVTATASDHDDLKRIEHEVQQLAASASIRLRVMKHMQDVGFQTSCGFGAVPFSKKVTLS